MMTTLLYFSPSFRCDHCQITISSFHKYKLGADMISFPHLASHKYSLSDTW